jgi:hypothetical protein
MKIIDRWVLAIKSEAAINYAKSMAGKASEGRFRAR